MPQCKNWRVSTDHVAHGKGSIFNSLVDVSVATRRRANLLNELEMEKLSDRARWLDKQSGVRRQQQQRLMQRLHHNLIETRAYKHVIDAEFKAHHFDTLTWGYKEKEARQDPERWQRFAYETKIYNSGFNKKNLKRKVNVKLQALDPEYIKKETHARQLEAIKDQANTFTIDRNARSLTVILKDYQQHKSSRNSSRRSDVTQNKDTLSSKNKDTLSSKNKDTLSGRNKDTLSDKNKDTLSGRNKDTLSGRNKDTLSGKNKDTLSSKNKDTLSGRNKVQASTSPEVLTDTESSYEVHLDKSVNNVVKSGKFNTSSIRKEEIQQGAAAQHPGTRKTKLLSNIDEHVEQDE